ncbi:MAG TPA: hypothetical protein PKH79_07010 [Prolixibacteraceae bacterium]|nr:hypothetical protein [Prolixibacteraceae bacterium]HPS13918.1 hypothetical protein [Prolixibacteraceae bacterium]
MKIILKIGILLATLLTSLLGLAESKSDKVYDLFNGKDGTTSLCFSKSAIEPFEIFLDDESKKVIYKMEKVKFLAYDENKGDLSASDVFNRIDKILSNDKYFTIDPDEINCDDCHADWKKENVRIIGHGEKKAMDEFHILVKDNNSCLLFSFFGNITVADLKYCTKFSKSVKIDINNK